MLAAFADLGVPVFSSDDAVHALYAGAAVAPVEQLFPGITRDGVVDRAALSRALVAEPGRLRELEAVVHPLVRGEQAAFFERAASDGANLAVIDVPLLLETGHDYGLDRIIVTTVNETEQRRRALDRPGMTVEKLETILARQMPQSEKITHADYVIETSGAIADTAAAVRRIVQDLTNSNA